MLWFTYNTCKECPWGQGCLYRHLVKNLSHLMFFVLKLHSHLASSDMFYIGCSLLLTSAWTFLFHDVFHVMCIIRLIRTWQEKTSSLSSQDTNCKRNTMVSLQLRGTHVKKDMGSYVPVCQSNSQSINWATNSIVMRLIRWFVLWWDDLLVNPALLEGTRTYTRSCPLDVHSIISLVSAMLL